MNRLVFILLSLFTAAAFADSPLPSVADVFQKLGDFDSRPTNWKLVTTVPLANSRFPTYHPQGVKVLGRQVFLTSVKAWGRRSGHLTEFVLDDHDHPARALAVDDVVFDPGRKLIHAGGIDMLGGNIFVPLAENHSKGRSKIFSVSPANIHAFNVVATVRDHIGLVSTLADGFEFASWGSVKIYGLSYKGDRQVTAGTGWEYQDCKHIDETDAICSAKLGFLNPDGELQLIRFRKAQPPLILHRIKVPSLKSDGTAGGWRPLTYNAMDFEPLKSAAGDVVGIRFYFVPHDDVDSRLMIFDAAPAVTVPDRAHGA